MPPPRWTTPPALRVLSWGGGQDSTTALLMSQHGELPRLDAAIFADTGYEPQAVYETLEWVTAAVTIPIYRVSAGRLGEDILVNVSDTPHSHRPQVPFYVEGKDGRPSLLRRSCTEEYKVLPIRRKLRELLELGPRAHIPQGCWVEQWIGFPRDEIGRTFCSDVQWITNTFPLIIPAQMSKRDCAQWLTSHGYPIPPKSSCTFCPYHSNAYWRDMRDHRPNEWTATVEFERHLHAGKLPGVRGTPYLHKSMVPLPMAPIDVPDAQNEELFCHACNT
jgi:hypothetical protein